MLPPLSSFIAKMQILFRWGQTVHLIPFATLSFLHSKQKYAYDTHNTTHTELYIGNIFLEKFTHIITTYKISVH